MGKIYLALAMCVSVLCPSLGRAAVASECIDPSQCDCVWVEETVEPAQQPEQQPAFEQQMQQGSGPNGEFTWWDMTTGALADGWNTVTGNAGEIVDGVGENLWNLPGEIYNIGSDLTDVVTGDGGTESALFQNLENAGSYGEQVYDTWMGIGTLNVGNMTADTWAYIMDPSEENEQQLIDNAASASAGAIVVGGAMAVTTVVGATVGRWICRAKVPAPTCTMPPGLATAQQMGLPLTTPIILDELTGQLIGYVDEATGITVSVTPGGLNLIPPPELLPAQFSWCPQPGTVYAPGTVIYPPAP